MLKFIALPVFIALFFAAAPVWLNVASAQESNVTTKNLPVSSSESFRTRAGNLSDKLLAASERTSNFFERAGTLITKFEERGLDMTLARTAQTQAAAAIEQAKLAIEKFKNEVATVTAKSLQAPVKKTASEANQAIKEAHAKVVEVIRSIKASYNKPATTPVSSQTCNEGCIAQGYTQGVCTYWLSNSPPESACKGNSTQISGRYSDCLKNSPKQGQGGGSIVCCCSPAATAAPTNSEAED